MSSKENSKCKTLYLGQVQNIRATVRSHCDKGRKQVCMTGDCLREGVEVGEVDSNKLMQILWTKARTGHFIFKGYGKLPETFNHISLATVLRIGCRGARVEAGT